MTLKEGQKAPDFSLKDKDSQIVKLSEIDSNYVVIYFYPKDDTPGCSIEGMEFTSTLDYFDKIDTKVIGISGGNEKSKEKFCDKYGLRVTLLSDSNFEVSSKYRVYGEKNFMGKKYMGIIRTTFILDKNKKIIKIYNKVKAIGHAKKVLRFIEELK